MADKKTNYDRDQVDAFLKSPSGFWAIAAIIGGVIIAVGWDSITGLFA